MPIPYAANAAHTQETSRNLIRGALPPNIAKCQAVHQPHAASRSIASAHGNAFGKNVAAKKRSAHAAVFNYARSMTKSPNIAPHAPAAIAIKVIEAAGWQAWIVGGWVRDSLIGNKPHDADIATNAPWTRAKEAFAAAGCPVHETGVKHSTITAIVNGEPIEVTTYRTEGPYSDSRHPDYVKAAETIEADLARRDFTMNAIAFHPLRGFVDPYGGRKDIEKKTIRSVGRAEDRFAEDPLRIMRAIRFSSQLGFSIEKDTHVAAAENACLLELVARERIGSELSKLLMGAHAGKTIEEEIGIIAAIIPELSELRGFRLKSKKHSYDLLGHLAHSVDAAPYEKEQRWAALLHDIAKPRANHDHAEKSAIEARKIMRRIRIDRKTIEGAVEAIAWHMVSFPPNEQALKLFIACFGGDVSRAKRALILQRSDALGHGPGGFTRARQVDRELEMLEAIALEGAPLKAADLAIDGSTVALLGDVRDVQISQTIEALVAAVIEGEVANEEAALIAYLPHAREAACEHIFQKRLEKFLT